MASPPAADPVRATLLAVLKQLNQADAMHEGQAPDQALELGELEQRLHDFWAVDQGAVKVGHALGLLLRNGLVQAQADAEFSWQRQRDVAQRYLITAEGKRFLVGALENSDRIG